MITLYNKFMYLISLVATHILRPLTRVSIVCHTRNSYKYVNAEEHSMDMKDITDRAAQNMFWTELFRGKQGCNQVCASLRCFFLVPGRRCPGTTFIDSDVKHRWCFLIARACEQVFHPSLH
jgi:hypothetical protein